MVEAILTLMRHKSNVFEGVGVQVPGELWAHHISLELSHTHTHVMSGSYGATDTHATCSNGRAPLSLCPHAFMASALTRSD